MANSIEDYRKEWIREVNAGNPSTLELGQRFARKLVMQWLNISEDSEDSENIIHCDGSKDGGIDIAYLKKADVDISDENFEKGDTWYVIQSKHGKPYKGAIFSESIKFFETLLGNREKLSSLSENVVERLRVFLSQASENDRLVYVFATKEPFDEKGRSTLNYVRALGKNKFGEIFDVESISIDTIYERLFDITKKVDVSIKGQFIETDELLVGAVTLENLYYFLRHYYLQTGDLDRLYEKNVRLFLKMYGNVNKNIKKTLEEYPENFGLYNNGITIVVDNIEKLSNTTFKLKNPYIVNGCQTTSIIYQFLYNRLESGGTGSPSIDTWKAKFSKSVVITKIVKANQKKELLTNITRYTNSQTRVREKDFLALDSEFKEWQVAMEKFYGIFLEIQRGSWEAQMAKQKLPNQRRKNAFKFENHAHTNIFDLLRVYAAGWMEEAGKSRNAGRDFLPGGRIYKKIMISEDGNNFGHTDLYASFSLKEMSKKYKFGHGAKESRRKTEYLFYMVTIKLLKHIMQKAGIKDNRANITDCVLKLSKDQESYNFLFESSIDFIDEYMDKAQESSVFNEPGYLDLDTYLKNEKVGKDSEYSPRFKYLLDVHKSMMIKKRETSRGQLSIFEIILESIKKTSV